MTHTKLPYDLNIYFFVIVMMIMNKKPHRNHLFIKLTYSFWVHTIFSLALWKYSSTLFHIDTIHPSQKFLCTLAIDRIYCEWYVKSFVQKVDFNMYWKELASWICLSHLSYCIENENGKKLCQREPHHYVEIKNSSINCNLLWFLFDFIISTNRSGTIVLLFCVREDNETNPICICDELMSVFWKLRCFEVIEWNKFVHPIEFEGQHHKIVT